MKTITIANEKGGVAKTTTAINIATALVEREKKVLLIDMDSQGNSTYVYKAARNGVPTIYNVLKKEADLTEAIQRTEMGDIVAGDENLTNYMFEFQGTAGGYRRLENGLKTVADYYDYCIIDTHPDSGIYMLTALNASNGVVIPVKAEAFSLTGLNHMIESVNDVKEELNPDLKLLGLLLTVYDKRNKLDQDVWRDLQEFGQQEGYPVFSTPVRISQDVKKAQTERKNIYKSYTGSKAAFDYARITDEIMEMVKEK